MRVLAVLACVLFFGLGVLVGYDRGQESPGCLEGEVLAALQGPAPSRGLTWRCERLSDLLAAEDAQLREREEAVSQREANIHDAIADAMGDYLHDRMGGR